MKQVVFGFFVIFVVSVARGITLPSEIRQCPRSNADYKECIKKAATDALLFLGPGNDVLGMQPIDPLSIKSVHINGNGGKVDLEQDYVNLKLDGLSRSEFMLVNVEIGKEKCLLTLETLTPVVHMYGDYSATGKLLLFALNGKGKMNITLLDIKVGHELHCEVVEKGGEEYVKVKKYTVDLGPKSLLLDFENLVDGNAELSAEILKVMNENSQEIFDEVKKDYDAAFGEVFKHAANWFFDKVPYKIAYPD